MTRKQEISIIFKLTRLMFAGFLLFGLNACSIIIQQKTIRYIKYTAQRGDNITSIAKRFNVSASEIIEINEFNQGAPILSGQFIKIPYRGQPLSKKDQETYKKALVTLSRPQPKESAVKTVRLSKAGKYIGKLKWPLATEGKISSPFGRRWFSFHEGIDISEASGTHILAALDGTVVYSGHGLTGYGNLVVIKSVDILTVYGHNKVNRVKVGDKVKKGDWIADLGSTGKSSGPHLHFETRLKDEDGRNVAVDPMVFFP